MQAQPSNFTKLRSTPPSQCALLMKPLVIQLQLANAECLR